MVSTHLKNISQIGNLPQIEVKIKNLWNHHLVLLPHTLQDFHPYQASATLKGFTSIKRSNASFCTPGIWEISQKKGASAPSNVTTLAVWNETKIVKVIQKNHPKTPLTLNFCPALPTALSNLRRVWSLPPLAEGSVEVRPSWRFTHRFYPVVGLKMYEGFVRRKPSGISFGYTKIW